MSRLYKLYKNIVIIISILTIYVTISFYKGYGYDYIWTIPVIYLMLFLFAKDLHYYSNKYKGLYMLNIIMFVKYILTNLFTVILQDYELAGYYVIYVYKSSYYWGTFLIVVEMVSIFIFIELFAKKIYGQKNDMKIDKDYNNMKFSFFIYGFIILCSALIFLYPNEFIENSMIIFSNENSVTESIESSNVFVVIFNSFKIIVIGSLINLCIVKFQENQKIRYVFLSYISIVIFIFLNISTSRLNMIIPFILFLMITARIFKKKGIIFDVVIIIGLVLLFQIISIYKNPWTYTSEQSVFETLINFAKGLQFYTSGIAPNAIGLQCIDEYNSKISLFTLFNDILGSIPLVSHIIPQNDRIYTYYNLYALGGSSNSQLISMSVSSIAYFSKFFAPLAVLINVYLLMRIEAKQKITEKNFLSQYMKLYLYFIFASCIISNVQMLSGRFFVRYLPTMIILLLNNMISTNIKIRIRRASNIYIKESNGA